TAPAEALRHVELFTMAAFYHRAETLNLGQTFSIGEPWLEGSLCDHMLVSLPYPLGPDLENCCSGDMRLRLYWLLPITARERAFKIRHGQEELEQRFDAVGLEYWDPH